MFFANVPPAPAWANHSPGSYVEKLDNFLASRRWLGFFKFCPEVGLESAYFIG